MFHKVELKAESRHFIFKQCNNLNFVDLCILASWILFALGAHGLIHDKRMIAVSIIYRQMEIMKGLKWMQLGKNKTVFRADEDTSELQNLCMQSSL